MRIQHNIMAMGAYRNYSNNISAMKKNLEKLSSGYKINRAGDDAAGLAISEKMRAQITGLETAQKNAKDGISLVQTAEGALTEVHDMLNRMVELASMSANGTYDNTTDRAQLQKEMDQLNAEIDRIADSANFNGIKLLDGSMSVAGIPATESTFNDLPGVGETLGVDTVLHKGQGTPSAPTTFSIDLHNLEISGEKGKEFTIDIGGTKLVGTLQQDFTGDGNALSATDIATALGDSTVTGSVTFAYEDGTAYDSTQATFGPDGSTFTAEATGTRVTFTHDGASEEIDPDMKVSISSGNALASKIGTVTSTVGKDAVGKTKSTYVASAAPAQVTLAEGKAGNQYTLTIGGKAVTVTATSDGNDLDDLIGLAAGSLGGTITGNNLVFSGLAGASSANAASIAAALEAAKGVTGGTATYDSSAGSWVYTVAHGVASAADASGVNNTYTVTVDGNDIDISGVSQTTASAQLGAKYAAALNADATFSAKFSATADATGKVTLTAKEKGKEVTSGIAETDTGMTGGTWTEGDDIPAVTAESIIDFTGKTGADVWGGSVTIGDVKYTFVEDAGDVDPTEATAVVVGADDDAAAIATALFAANVNDATEVTVTNDVDGQVKYTAVTAGAAGNDLVKAEVTKAGASPEIKGDYNVSTTVLAKKGDDGNYRLASTYFTLKDSMVADGNKIKIGNKEYTFSSAKADEGKADVIYTGDLDAEADDYMTQVAERLTQAAANNEVYTVGHDGSRISVTENVAWDNGDTDAFDLTTLEGVQKSLGFSTAAKEGKGLTLQIGDTADSYNQLTVDIKDMHAASLGLDKISIADQDSAAKAIDVIKNAINTVSDVRGTLGATQNRLDHTINNLSVMTENIQDAESTIRDVDVAEEMMAYTKNNILIQSAQAMLAQANQVPQGVLQLLQ